MVKGAKFFKIQLFMAIALVVMFTVVMLVKNGQPTSVKAATVPQEATQSMPKVIALNVKNPFQSLFQSEFEGEEGVNFQRIAILNGWLKRNTFTKEEAMGLLRKNIEPTVSKFIDQSELNDKNFYNIVFFSSDVRLGIMAYEYYTTKDENVLKALLVYDRKTDQNFINLKAVEIQELLKSYFDEVQGAVANK